MALVLEAKEGGLFGVGDNGEALAMRFEQGPDGVHLSLLLWDGRTVHVRGFTVYGSANVTEDGNGVHVRILVPA